MGAWSSIRSQIQLLADDGAFESAGNLYSYLLPWANSVQLEIATEADIKAHLKTVEGDLTTDNHAWYLPSDYLKTLERFTKIRVGDNYVPIIGFEELNSIDADHSEISTNTQPSYAAIEGGILYIYPKWAGTIVIENYIRRPVDMAADTDTVDLPEASITDDMIVAGVAGKYCFPHLNEWELAALYYNKAGNSGRFFELMNTFKRYIGNTQTVWSNRGRYF
jgi:hypothetical protein